jgi:hypothetical protein
LSGNMKRMLLNVREAISRALVRVGDRGSADHRQGRRKFLRSGAKVVALMTTAIIPAFLIAGTNFDNQEKQEHMTSWDLGKTQTRCVGRFDLQLPEAAILNRQSQEVDGISLELNPLPENTSLETLQSNRRNEILRKRDSPIVNEYRWDHDMAGILYVGDTSDPAYLFMEGRRLIGQSVFVASTSGDQKKAALMEQIITEALRNYRPNQMADGKTPGFCVTGGLLQQSFRNAEEAHASFVLPQPGALLEISTEVVAVPGKADLIVRERQAAAIAMLDNVSVRTLRQGTRRVAGIDGVESVVAGTEKGHTGFDARFEAAGRPTSAQESQMQLHLTTERDLGYRSDSMTKEQFLALWDALLDRISSHL